jgi:hypothetical protein
LFRFDRKSAGKNEMLDPVCGSTDNDGNFFGSVCIADLIRKRSDEGNYPAIL